MDVCEVVAYAIRVSVVGAMFIVVWFGRDCVCSTPVRVLREDVRFFFIINYSYLVGEYKKKFLIETKIILFNYIECNLYKILL